MVKAILRHATIWITIYWAITMLIFGLSGYFLCVHFEGNNNVLFCVFLSFSTLIVSFLLGYIIFINMYKHFNKRRH